MAIGLVRVVGAAPIARQPADRGDGAAAPIIPVSMSGQIDHTVEVILRRERSGRPLCANSGHSPRRDDRRVLYDEQIQLGYRASMKQGHCIRVPSSTEGSRR
jgi:hypothetical protein